MKIFRYLPLFAVLLFACNSNSVAPVESMVTDDNAGNVEQINEVLNPNDFRELMAQENNLVLLDIRTPDELKENGTIEGAINVDFYKENFLDEIAKLNKNEAVYVYCRSGGRSSEAAKIFKNAGFKEVYDLEGGYNAWLANSNK